MTGSTFLKGFTEFINEKLGVSNSVEEYSKIILDELEKKFQKYLSFKFKKDFTNYSEDLVFNNFKDQVSPETSRDFPINNLIIKFRIVAVKSGRDINYSGFYVQDLENFKIKSLPGGAVNLEILCKIHLRSNKLDVNLDKIKQAMSDVIMHELTHAYQEYKTPEYKPESRLYYLKDEMSKYSFLKETRTLKNFLTLLYKLSDSEIAAIVGERKSFKNKNEFYQYEGTQLAEDGLYYNPEEYYEAIMTQLEGNKYWPYLNTHFGEFLVELYLTVGDKKANIDPKILSLSESAGLRMTLKFFEPYIKSQAEKLFRKLSKKITVAYTVSPLINHPY
jgi:hypothetical protein